MDQGTPRRSVESDPVRAIALQLADLRKAVAELAKSANLRNASISGGDGLAVNDADGNLRLRISPEEGAILAYDATGAEVARYGLLSHTDVGQFGIEALTAAGWSHVGSGGTTWAAIDSKPATFPPDAHTHPGSQVTSAVAQAEGSQYAYDNNVGGTSWYAVYVGNNGGYKFGRNTSSARYKENIRDFTGDISDLLAVRPVLFDRKPSWADPPTWTDPHTGTEYPAEGPVQLIPGRKDEYGFIAEEMLEVWPEVVQWFDHGDGAGPVVDGIRYEMIGARLIPILQGMLIAGRTAARRITELETRITGVQDQATAQIIALRGRVKTLEDRDTSFQAQLDAQAKLIQDLQTRIEAMP